jgi:hypothetical protein
LDTLESECRKKKAKEQAKESPARTTTLAPTKEIVKCFNCGETGHYSSVCPKKKRTETPTKSPGPSVKKSQVEDEDDSVSGKRLLADTSALASETVEAANKRVACLRTPCYLEGEKVIAFVDGGATTSFVDRQWIEKRGLAIEPRTGTLTQFVDGSTLPRIGVVSGLCLENGKKSLRVDLEVANLSGEEEVVLGIDLFESLGFQVLGVPFAWPSRDDDVKTKAKVPTNQELPNGIGSDGMAEEWKEVIARNQAISVFQLNAIPNSELHLPTGSNSPIFVRQYPIPEGLRAAVTERVELWKTNNWVVPAPPGCRWNSPILAAKKSGKEVGESDDIRVCINSRLLNDRLVDDPDSRLPLVREVIDHLGPFQWITTLDLADSYHQFAIAEEDQPKLAFTWNGEQLIGRVAPFGVTRRNNLMRRVLQEQIDELQAVEATRAPPVLAPTIPLSQTRSKSPPLVTDRITSGEDDNFVDSSQALVPEGKTFLSRK